MTQTDIEKTVDCAFDQALSKIKPAINRELYPAAFADEYSWLHVQAAFDLNNTAIRFAVKEALVALLVKQE